MKGLDGHAKEDFEGSMAGFRVEVLRFSAK